ALEPLEGQPDRRQLNTPYRSNHSGLCDAAGEYTFGKRSLIKFKCQRGDIARRLAARTDYKVDVGEIPRDGNRGIRVLVTVRENQVESPRSKVTKSVFKVRGRPRLHQRGFSAEFVFYKLQAIECRRIPAGIADRSRRQESNTKSCRAGRAFARRCAATEAN